MTKNHSTRAIDPRKRALAQWRRCDTAPDEIARKNSWKPSEQIIPQVLRTLRIDRRQSESEILRVWNHQIDPNIAAHAHPTGIHNGTLFVAVDSSVWLHEILRYRRHEILERLQNSFGRALIARISFRAG